MSVRKHESHTVTVNEPSRIRIGIMKLISWKLLTILLSKLSNSDVGLLFAFQTVFLISMLLNSNSMRN